MDLLPAPGNDNDTNHNNQQDGRKQAHPDAHQRRRKPEMLSADECVIMLSALPRLVTLGLLSPAQANSIRSTCQAILNFYGQQDAAPHRRPVDQDGLRQALRANPQLANYLAGVLSDDDIADLLAGED